MKLSGNFVRANFKLLKPLFNESAPENERKSMATLGKLLSRMGKSKVDVSDLTVNGLPMAMVSPKDELSRGVILYLHGGGYSGGDITYAKGFSTVLASKMGIKVLAVEYRLAPEHIFPAAVDDCLTAYEHLLSLGYSPEEILLAGESAGGGLCYSLCLKLREAGRKMPAGIIAISPWTDLTASGKSYEENKRNDLSMKIGRLTRFADRYIYGKDTPNGNKEFRSTEEDILKDKELKQHPLASPLFADLTGMPPSIIFVGEHEIMRDDATGIHTKLLKQGAESHIYIGKKKWHAYILYCLYEDREDFNRIARFVKSRIPARKLRWMSLDNAAKIYPAARRRNWTNVFRLSATLTEDVDKDALQRALDITVRRFPSIAVRLKTGMFWYYIEEIPKAPDIMDEKPYPLSRMFFDDIRKCALRVLVYQKRIAVEFFHALTDGNGGLIFLKTLLCEYVKEKYKENVTPWDGILNVLDEPTPEELEDSFLKYSGGVKATRADTTAFKLTGTRELDGYVTNTTFIFDSADIIKMAKEMKVTVTSLFSAIMLTAAARIQEKKVRNIKRRKPVKILIPVNLRKMFPSCSLRNFVLYVTPGIDPRYGEYTVQEAASLIQSQMAIMNTPKQMRARIAKNVGDEKALIIKLMPLFIKNLAMKMVFNAVGERKSCFALSNLGVCTLPPEIDKYVTKMGFVLGVQAKAPYNTGLITYKDKMYLNFVRNIKEPLLEREFYQVLKELNIKTVAESNSR